MMACIKKKTLSLEEEYFGTGNSSSLGSKILFKKIKTFSASTLSLYIVKRDGKTFLLLQLSFKIIF